MALYVRQTYLTSMQMNTIPDCRFNLRANYDSQNTRKWFEQIISHLLRTHTHERREPTNLGDIPVFLAACGVCAFISLLLAGGIVYCELAPEESHCCVLQLSRSNSLGRIVVRISKPLGSFLGLRISVVSGNHQREKNQVTMIQCYLFR